MQDRIPLQTQLNFVFSEIEDELAHMNSGTLIVQIRDDTIGKFGLRHDSLSGKGGELEDSRRGMSKELRTEFRKMAIRSLKYKQNWTYGEMMFDFKVVDGILHTNIQFESNYNLSKIPIHKYI